MAKSAKNFEDTIEMSSENGGNPIELFISKEKKERVSELLVQMSNLTNIEKLYMHLKLPPCPVVEDENKSESPPSGSVSRTSMALNWVQSHYVEDRRVCLPKQEVYNHYKFYCNSNGIHPFAMTDFGKVMKTAFPSVHDRRLGQRGKSKYFYGGLRRKSTNGDTSDQESVKTEDPQPSDHEEELDTLSSQLVCEWASCLLGKNFSSVKSLAQYLVFSGASCGKKAALFNMLLDMDGWGPASMTSDKRKTESLLQDTQALLQRKLHQKEVLKEHKSLLKKLEDTQKDAFPAAHPTVARLAVLSPSLHALHSLDTSTSHPSTVHVLNVQRNMSSSSNPILSLRQEISEQQKAVLDKSASDGYTGIKMNKLSQNEIQSVEGNASQPFSDTNPQIDKLKSETKHFKMKSSKSLEEGNQRQSKRNSDFLYSANQEGNSKRRRCITSLGMSELKEQSSESVAEKRECKKEAAVTRPFSCPVFKDPSQLFISDMESEDIETSTQYSETTKVSKEIPDIDISSSENHGDKASKAESSSSSFHFVRKPTVISIKPPEVNENNEPLCSNVNDNLCDSDNVHLNPVKKSNRIMSSILSSSDSNIPHHFSSVTNNLASLTRSSCGDSQMMDESFCQNKDADKTIKREAHTLDNAYLLPCQSSRSAFVRVMNGKGHSSSEIIPRPRHSSFDESVHNGHSKENDNGGSPDTIDKLFKSKRSQEIPNSFTKSSVVVDEATKPGPGEGFKSIAVSSSDRVPLTVLDMAKEEKSEVPIMSSISIESVCLKSNSSESLRSTPMQLTSPTMTSPVNAKRLTSKSPVTPPKRHQSRSRFTPIRPKITGCCNISPQKKDMRPVSTILKEQRARSAQELLVNLATSYQGGIKVQLPSELLELSSDQSSNISSVLGSHNNQNLSCQTAVILEPVSFSNSINSQASPLISPQTNFSSSDITTVPPVSSTLSNLLTGGSIVSESSSFCSSNHQSTLIPSSPVLSSTNSTSTQSQESPVVVANTKAAMYSLSNADVGRPLPKVSSLQQLLQGSKDQTKSPSSKPIQQSLINVSNIKGHVVGPNANGQTFLLVPNSESVTLPTHQTVLKTSSTNSTSISRSPKMKHSMSSRLTPNSGISSAALLSELSQLASVSSEDIAKQPVIKHDSTISAFQKCEPNKFVTDNSNDANSQVRCQKGIGNYSDCESVSYDEILDGQVIGSDICLRKRKASKSQDDKSNEKRRHNTDNSEVNEVVFAKTDDQIEQNKESVLENKQLTYEAIGESYLLSANKMEASDTEALLNLIDTRSMTVKQTVMAMNSLKAQMKMSGLPIPAVKMDENPIVKEDDRMESTTSNTGLSDKVLKRTLHVIKRNTSLNLESLESDALLDTELSIDHHLVGDIKLCKNGKLDNKTSVAVAAKSHRSRSLDKQKEQSRKNKDSSVPTISSKAIHSYQMILNEKNRPCKDKKAIKEVVLTAGSQSKDGGQNEDKVVTGNKPERRGQRRRCVSSTQDVLQSRSKPLSSAFECQNTKSQSEVDAFDALLSKMHSKQLSTRKDNILRSHSSLVQESELPVDIIDFVTESMFSRRDSLEANSALFNNQESVGARSISVPNTKPDFIDLRQSHANLVSSAIHNRSQFSTESSQLCIQPAVVDSMSNTEDAETTSSKNVFLSPIGPAKLARRSSVEKSLVQGQIDRSVTKTPIEISSPSSMVQFASSERIHRTKTPVDKALSIEKSKAPITQSIDKGYKSPVNRTLVKTPVEKYFIKQLSDPLPPRSDLMLPTLVSVSREDTSSVQTLISDGGYTSGSVSQTPNSEFGRSSVSQTPVSDIGYSSVSPSPVMMSSAIYIGDCGRNLSPATIFMPLRSDSALSLNSNNIRSESPTNANVSNQNDVLSEVSNTAENHSKSKNCPNEELIYTDKKDKGYILPQFTSEISEFPSLLESLNSKALFLNDMEDKEDSSIIKSTSNTKTLLNLLTSPLQSIPTPPVSPSISPPNTLPLPFSIPSSPLPCPGTSPLTLTLSTAPCFAPPISSSSSSLSMSAHIQHGRQFGPSPHFRSQDLPSPALTAHSYTPSPQVPARPPSSPQQYSSHPSPPFTPCSLRSLPSPRCMTPISHKSLISPRSVTPSSDPCHAAPNRFMPIQSSGVLPTSQTTTPTYIQPIRPVVALASASSSHNNSNTGTIKTSGPQSSNGRSLLVLSTSNSSVGNSGLTHNLQFVTPKSSHSLSLSQPVRHGIDSTNSISTSEHKPLKANSTLVLSLSGDIGPLSNQGGDLTWGNAESSTQGQIELTKHTSAYGKQLDVLHQAKDSVNKSNKSQQSLVFKSQLSLSSACTQPHHSKSREHSISSSILKLPKSQPSSNLPDHVSKFLMSTISSSSRAFKPPLSLSSSVCSFKPVTITSTTIQHPNFSKLEPASVLPQSQSPSTAMCTLQKFDQGVDRNRGVHSTQNSTQSNKESDGSWVSNTGNQTLLNLTAGNGSAMGGINNLNPSAQDELQATLDVLKDMDGQYFL